jgi:hypothetical protein
MLTVDPSLGFLIEGPVAVIWIAVDTNTFLGFDLVSSAILL